MHHAFTLHLWLLSVLGLLGLILSTAVYFDIRQRRIPNKLIVLGILSAFIVHSIPTTEIDTLYTNSLLKPIGVLGVFGGLLSGFIASIGFYVFRIMAAGDIKLISLICAFVGPAWSVPVLLYTLIAGGFVAVAYALHQAKLTRLFHASGEHLKSALSTHHGLPSQTLWRMPYALAIALGTLAVLAHKLWAQ